MDADDVRAILQKEIDALGSQAALARRIPCSFDYLNGVMRRRLQPGPRILAALGLRRVMRYEPAAAPASVESVTPGLPDGPVH